MATDFRIELEDRPGALADLGEALGSAGVNIDGMCGVRAGDRGIIHILVEDADAARRALQGKGVRVQEERPVLVLEVDDRPGELGTVSRRIAEAGVNIELVYLATKTRLVVGAAGQDLEKARAAVTG